MGVSTTSGARLYVGPSVNVDDLEDLDYAARLAFYEGLTWVEVGEVENFGDHGDSSDQATFASVTDRRMRKMKTVRDAGTMTVVVGRDADDPGQMALDDAEGEDYNYAFKIAYKDAEDPSFNDSIDYFAGQVLSKATNMGTVGDVTKKTYAIAINTDVTEDTSSAIAIPANVVRPSISGASLAQGSTLTADPGNWSNSPTSYGYQWQADAAGNGVFANIVGATAKEYVLAAGQAGDAVRVQVTATNAAGTAAAVNSLSVGLVV